MYSVYTICETLDETSNFFHIGHMKMLLELKILTSPKNMTLPNKMTPPNNMTSPKNMTSSKMQNILFFYVLSLKFVKLQMKHLNFPYWSYNENATRPKNFDFP